MGNYTIFICSKILGEAGKQEILQQIVPKILGLKSSSEQIFSRKLPLGAPDQGFLNISVCFSAHSNTCITH